MNATRLRERTAAREPLSPASDSQPVAMAMSDIGRQSPIVRPECGSLVHVLVFWVGLFLLAQQVQRIVLFCWSSARGSSTIDLIGSTFAGAVWHDFLASIVEVGVVAVVALIVTVCVLPLARPRTLAQTGEIYRKSFMALLPAMAVLLLVALMVDMGYYRFSHRHLDFVFFEYVDDLWRATDEGTPGSQAAQQTSGELNHAKGWTRFVAAFLFFEAVGALAWWTMFHRHLRHASGVILKGVLCAVLAVGVIGSSSHSVSSLPTTRLASLAVAENPILASWAPLRDAALHQWNWIPRLARDVLRLEEALPLSQHYIDRHGDFADPMYPFARAVSTGAAFQSHQRMNVLVIFVEGLDRRYLNRSIESDHPVRLAPFLDRFKQDSVYFGNFFANGVQTSRGLFATLCSYFPRHGAAAIKTRSSQEFLCLPSVLRKEGYRTEMVVGQSGSISNLRTFFTRHGIDYFYDINDYPAQAERMGLGATDSAIFDFIRQRLKDGQERRQPVFLTTLTLSTHHPFVHPVVHPDVQALKSDVDPYLAALRYFDLEFERFVTESQRDGLLKNTLMIVLGDHGRHESLERNEDEQRVGHFFAPLFIWADESWKTQNRVKARTVDTIASQVDVTPTVLSIVGMMPRIAPFVGHDLSCLLAGDCLDDNTAYLSSAYDDLIALVSKEGFLLYSFQEQAFDRTDPAGHSEDRMPCVAAAKTGDCRTLLALYLASNVLLEENRIWSQQGLWPPTTVEQLPSVVPANGRPASRLKDEGVPH